MKGNKISGILCALYFIFEVNFELTFVMFFFISLPTGGFIS